MDKRVLRGLRVRSLNNIEITKVMKLDKKIKYIIAADVKSVADEKILELSIFDINKSLTRKGRPMLRTFMSDTDYITQDLEFEKIKWKTGAIVNMLEISYWQGSWQKVKLLDNKSKVAIEKFVEVKDDHLIGIDRFQAKIMKKRLDDKYKKITDPIDGEMKYIPSLPSDFEEWIDSVAFYNSKYIYYEYTNKALKYGYCTHCKKDVRIDKPKHNQIGTCANCGERITFKVLGKAKNIKDEVEVTLIQREDEKIIVREFWAYKEYKSHFRNPSVRFIENRRTIWKDKEYKIYEYAEFRQSGNVRWCNNENKIMPGKSVLYERNLEILKDTNWKYSAIKELATNRRGFRFEVLKYMYSYLSKPALEYLVKLKLYKLACEYSICYSNVTGLINDKAKKIQDTLKVNKSYIQLLQRLDAGSNELKIVQDINEYNYKVNEDQIREIKARDLSWNLIKESINYTTVNKTLRYIDRQEEYESTNLVLRDWIDYIKDCKTLKFDLKNDFILFPKDLKKAHQGTIDMITLKNNKKSDIAIKKLSEEIGKQYEYEDTKYKIIFPTTALAIIKEGQSLHHCVGGYVELVVKKQTIIMFVRKKDNLDKSFYTIEISKDNKITQCRGLKNEPYELDKEVKKLINKYKRQILKPLKNKELQIGA